MSHEFIFRGQRLPVSNMFDENGDETFDPDEADTVVCPLPSGEWLGAKAFSGELREITNGKLDRGSHKT